ncbi:MAG: CoA pyrophosphatase [Magnetovibrio sp.]|nr:CoA pyrophosphatase [Magnetovibrio sp.]
MERSDIIAKLNDRPPRTDGVRGDHELNPTFAMQLPPGDELVPAAVLIPIVEHTDGITVMFTQRTNHLAHHPGQISFPGGHVDPGDDTPEETALRETEEEVGLHRRHIEIVGRLDQYRVRTGFSVTPVVGFVTPPFDVEPDPHEVAEVFEVPLDFLMDPTNHQRHSRDYKGTERQFYAMPYGGYYIWGATAGMLVNLYHVLRDG